MRRKVSASTGWDLLAGYSNPVPADLPRALHELGITAVRTVEHDGVEEVLAHCPMHKALTGREDRRPSFWVNGGHGAFICFSCHYSGPFVQLVVDALDIDRAGAVRWIAAQGIYRLRSTDDVTPKALSQEGAITEAAIALYVPPPAKALESRKLTAGACERYGVLWDTATDHWILPIREPLTGALLGWQEKGRKFFCNRPDGVPKSSAVFGYHQLVDGDTAILLESPLDAVRLASVGIPGGVASYGAYVSDTQMRLLRRRVDRVVLALDNDTAGLAAAAQVYARWRPRGLRMKFLNYTGTEAKDVGDMTDAQIHAAVEGARAAYARKK